MLVGEGCRIPTPQPSAPEPVAQAVAEIAKHFAWEGRIGCTFPAVVKNGVTYTAANVDKAWIGADTRKLFQDKTGNPVSVLNDADAAGLAEMKFGVGKDRMGVVMMLTFGTGIGSAVFLDGRLLPNTELGHLEIRCKEAEQRASDRIREEKSLSWKQWAKRVNEVLGRLEALFSPDLFIFGGGVSKHHDRYLHRLHTRAPVVPAQLLNDAGIVGAALAAASDSQH